MLPVDKDKISKLKHIYQVRQDAENNIHIEKFPIIYINSKFIYYKANGDDMLSILPVKDIREKFPDDYDVRRYNAIYFWFSAYKSQREIDEEINDLKYQIKESEKTKKIKELNNSIRKKIEELQKMQKELERYENGR